MRFRNSISPLEVHAVSGTHTVLLSLDLPRIKAKKLLGFAIERHDQHTNQRIWLEGMKCFKSLLAKPLKGESYPSNIHPIQSFFWMDYAVEPGKKYTYKIFPVYGISTQLTFGEETSIEVTSEPFSSSDNEHEVYFNRGVSGSQYYSRRFGIEKINNLSPETQKEALKWLQSGLYDAFIDFIEDAKNETYQLYGAFYEFHYPPVVEALKKASEERGATVKIICDGIKYRESNSHTVEEAGAENALNIKYRKVSGLKIPHNKFLILCKNNKPLKVWTGSTNISEKAFFGHCNTGHVIKNESIAKKYLKYWAQLYENSPMPQMSSLSLQLQPDANATDPGKIHAAFFSPRKNDGLLKTYAGLMDQASQMVCAVYPFNVDEAFQAIFNIDKPYLRFVIIDEKRKDNLIVSDDLDLKVTYGAHLKDPVAQWAREKSAGGLFYSGTDFVHNKFILIDPLTDHPIVITGSANFSKTSLKYNDENTLIIKGNKRVADIYLTEHSRLYNHYHFRNYLKNNPTGFIPNAFLDETDSWTSDYYKETDFSYKRKMIFKQMTL